MDPLIYLHLAFTPETPVELPLQPSSIWKKFSSLASLCLYPLIISLALSRFEQEVFYPLAQNFQVPAPLGAMPAYNPPATFYSSVETTSQPQTTNLNPQQILALQQRLQQLSLYSGPLDGTYNLQTRTAVTRAQVKYGISANELLNQP